MKAETSLALPGIASGARIGKNSKISPDAIIYDGAEVGDNCVIEPGVIIYENVKLGANCFIGAQCILGERVHGFRTNPNYVNPILSIGADSTIRSGTIIYASCTMGRGFQTGHRAVIREDSHFGDGCSFGTLSQSDGQI